MILHYIFHSFKQSALQMIMAGFAYLYGKYSVYFVHCYVIGSLSILREDFILSHKSNYTCDKNKNTGLIQLQLAAIPFYIPFYLTAGMNIGVSNDEFVVFSYQIGVSNDEFVVFRMEWICY